MADNTTITPGSGLTVAGDDISSVFYQRVKVSLGADGSARDWTGAATPHRALSAASNNATSVKASAGWLHYLVLTNLNATTRYFKLYNKASSPAPATDNALLTLVVNIPPSSLTPVIITFPNPVFFSTGIAYALVTGISDTDNTSVAASELLINLGYE